MRVEQGRLVLSKRDGEVIAKAPISEVWADRPRIGGGAVLKLTISGQTYTVEPARAHHSPVNTLGASAGNVARDIGRLKKGREMTEHFMAVLDAAGGHRGSPGADQAPLEQASACIARSGAYQPTMAWGRTLPMVRASVALVMAIGFTRRLSPRRGAGSCPDA